MANIVLGLATSHTPLFTLHSDDWQLRADADRMNPRLNLSDGRRLRYEELLAEVGPKYAEASQQEELARKAALCEAALDHLAKALAQARPDVVVVVGDDQGELFSPSNQPAIAICHNDTLITSDAFGREGSPDWVVKAGKGYLMDARHALPGHTQFALALIHGLVDQGVDVTAVADSGKDDKDGLGHAFGFIAKRLYGGLSIPMVPILLNTYFPPNVPTAARCHDIGLRLREVIEADTSSLRVAIVASGGLSHFVVDEALDRSVMAALSSQDQSVLRNLPRCALNSGSSEILNWVLTAGAMKGTSVTWSEYLPLYRTPAGTGVGAGFAIWQ
jgi:aromatic ring-opening dioxygenase catalytic subunit (LigB family)